MRTRRIPVWVAFILFCFVAVALFVLNLQNLEKPIYELGDLAANSFLIQDAKSGSLFHGNYSRVGFFHPGPVILYFLMTGEVLFHDVLGLTSPVGGQMASAYFYAGLWLAIILVALINLAEKTPAGVAGFSVFLIAIIYSVPELAYSIWMPYLYLLPFAAFCACLAVTVSGDARLLPGLALSAGVLINGHVSFVAILAVALVTALFLHGVLTASDPTGVRGSWFSVQFWRNNALLVAGSVVVGLVLLAPIAIETVVHYPGQVPLYFEYSSGNSWNDFSDSIAYFSRYWFQGLIGTSLTILSLSGLVAAQFLAPWRRGSLCLAVSLVSVSCGTLVYAVTGIDDLSLSYVTIFYYAVPALGLSIPAVLVTNLLSARGSAVVAGVAAAAAVLTLGIAATSRDAAAFAESDPNIPRAYEQLQSRESKFAIYPIPTSDWDATWMGLTGLQAYAARRGERPFCMAQRWHISFTEGYKCTSDELQSLPRLRATAASSQSTTLDPVAESELVKFYPMPDLELGRHYQPNEVDNPLIDAEGWHLAEDKLMWSADDAPMLRFFAPEAAETVTVELGALTSGDYSQTVRVSIDGEPARTVVFDAANGRRDLTFDLSKSDGGHHELLFKAPDPISPEVLGISGDTRPLGIAYFGLQFD